MHQEIVQLLKVDSTHIDLIDMPSARLAMRAVIAEEGFPLKTDTTAIVPFSHSRLGRAGASGMGHGNLRFDFYQQETAAIAALQGGLLDEAEQTESRASTQRVGVERRAVRVTTLDRKLPSSAKHLLKALNQPVPVSAYDTFHLLMQVKLISESGIQQWNNAIGLRDKIEHDYMNLKMDSVLALVVQEHYRFIVNFLQAPMPGQLSSHRLCINAIMPSGMQAFSAINGKLKTFLQLGFTMDSCAWIFGSWPIDYLASLSEQICINPKGVRQD